MHRCWSPNFMPRPHDHAAPAAMNRTQHLQERRPQILQVAYDRSLPAKGAGIDSFPQKFVQRSDKEWVSSSSSAQRCNLHLRERRTLPGEFKSNSALKHAAGLITKADVSQGLTWQQEDNLHLRHRRPAVLSSVISAPGAGCGTTFSCETDLSPDTRKPAQKFKRPQLEAPRSPPPYDELSARGAMFPLASPGLQRAGQQQQQQPQQPQQPQPSFRVTAAQESSLLLL